MLYDTSANCAFDSNLERFIRYPETLDPKTRRTVEKRLACDRAARSMADFYRGFYHELDALDEVASSRLEAFADALFAPLSPRTGM